MIRSTSTLLKRTHRFVNMKCISTVDAQETKKKFVIVGGVAGGATAAARVTRLSNNFDVTIIERSPDVSFANCGLPYYIGREIKDRSRLSLQTPESLSKALNIRVLTRTDATAIDSDNKTVQIKDLVTGQMRDLQYDTLILSPGASSLCGGYSTPEDYNAEKLARHGQN